MLHYDGDAADEGLRTYSSEVTQMYMRPLAEITSFLGPLELVPPGVVDARQWRQDWVPVTLPPRPGFVVAGVARKR